MRYLLLAAAVAACPGAFAQQSKEPVGDLETLQKIDQLQRGMQAADDLQHLVAKMAAARNMACVKAVGAPPFCSCLTENLPIKWTFPDYVAIVTTDKARNGYAKMSADDKKAYDAVPAVRDRCVKQSFGGKQ